MQRTAHGFETTDRKEKNIIYVCVCLCVLKCVYKVKKWRKSRGKKPAAEAEWEAKRWWETNAEIQRQYVCDCEKAKQKDENGNGSWMRAFVLASFLASAQWQRALAAYIIPTTW